MGEEVCPARTPRGRAAGGGGGGSRHQLRARRGVDWSRQRFCRSGVEESACAGGPEVSRQGFNWFGRRRRRRRAAGNIKASVWANG